MNKWFCHDSCSRNQMKQCLFRYQLANPTVRYQTHSHWHKSEGYYFFEKNPYLTLDIYNNPSH